MSLQVSRPLRQWPWLHLHHRGCAHAALHHHRHRHLLLLPSPPEPTRTTSNPHRFSSAALASSRRSANVPQTTTELDSDSESKKSRNELKREARRAVKWGMDLASFSAPQIKRVLRVLSLDEVVFEALMVVKRLGSDVREGRRRQFSYIGKLLRGADPELMDRLIRATRDSDQKELQALTGLVSDDVEEDDDIIESEDEEVEEESNLHDSQATRWFDGLINKDIQITNEVYSIQGVDFDRQELRKLVRRVHIAQERKADNEEDEKKIETAVIGAKKALTRFLRRVSKRIPDEFEYIS